MYFLKASPQGWVLGSREAPSPLCLPLGGCSRFLLPTRAALHRMRQVALSENKFLAKSGVVHAAHSTSTLLAPRNMS